MDTSNVPKLLFEAAKQTTKDYGLSAAFGAFFLWVLPSSVRSLAFYVGGIIFLSFIIAPFLVDWRPKRRISTGGKAVLISGCDSGFGLMLAQRLDDLGFHVFACCLSSTGLGATSLKKTSSSRLQVIELDVTKDDSVVKAHEFVISNLKDNVLWAVVCNAGINDGAEIAWTSLDTMKHVVEVNTFGVVRVVKIFLPLICKSQGRVVAVASAAGRCTYSGMVAYCMSKHAVISFCDGLRQELYRWGVQVITVEPWMYKTPITSESTIIDYITKTWDKAPEEVKKKYSTNYLDQYIKTTIHLLHYSISHKPSEVISCLEEGVTAKHPKYSYMPGTMYSRASFWLTRKLPQPVADFLVYKALGLRLEH